MVFELVLHMRCIFCEIIIIINFCTHEYETFYSDLCLVEFRWDDITNSCRHLKMLWKTRGCFMLYSQYQHCWWPGVLRSQGISINTIDLVNWPAWGPDRLNFALKLKLGLQLTQLSHWLFVQHYIVYVEDSLNYLLSSFTSVYDHFQIVLECYKTVISA